MLNEQRNQPHEGIQSVETFSSDQRRAVAGGSLVAECTVAQVHAHLSTQAEETGDEVVRLKDALLVHLLDFKEREERLRWWMLVIVIFSCSGKTILAVFIQISVFFFSLIYLYPYSK